jgi:hypothetical protein
MTNFFCPDVNGGLVPPLLIFFFLPHDQGEKGPA